MNYIEMNLGVIETSYLSQEGPGPIHLKTESMYPRAVYGGTGGIKTICNYAPVSIIIFYFLRLLVIIED